MKQGRIAGEAGRGWPRLAEAGGSGSHPELGLAPVGRVWEGEWPRPRRGYLRRRPLLELVDRLRPVGETQDQVARPREPLARLDLRGRGAIDPGCLADVPRARVENLKLSGGEKV